MAFGVKAVTDDHFFEPAVTAGMQLNGKRDLRGKGKKKILFSASAALVFHF